jgi:hypothetical protein
MPILTQTHVTLLIDATASMFPYVTQVVDGLNYYVKELCAHTPGPVFATLATFAEEVTVHYRQRPLHQVDKIRLETYDPVGQTALYDSIAQTLAGIPAGVTAPGGQRQLLIVLTDGEDVCSHLSLTMCAEQIAQAQAQGVRIVFLGDGDEALALAHVLGIPEGCRYSFLARDGLRGVFQMLATQTVNALTEVATRGLLPTRFFGN